MQCLSWDALEVGLELEPLVKPAIEKVQLVKYAGASGDFNMIHTDAETAKKVGLPGVIAHGMLSMGFLAEHAAAIVGTNGFVQDIKVRFAGMVRPGDVLTCKAAVAWKDDQLRRAGLNVSAVREADDPVTFGSVTLQYT